MSRLLCAASSGLELGPGGEVVHVHVYMSVHCVCSGVIGGAGTLLCGVGGWVWGWGVQA